MAKLNNDNIKMILDLDASKAQKEIIGTSQEIKRLSSANKELNKQYKESEKEVSKLNSAMEKMEKNGKQNTDEYNSLKKSLQDATKNSSDYQAQINANNRSIDENKQKHQDLTSSLKNEDMTMTQLRKKAGELKNQLNNTSASASPEAYAKLQKELQAVKTQMGITANAGKSTIDVLLGMNNPAGSAARAVMGVAQSLKALIANPVGAVIMVIVGAFIAFKKAINSSEEAANKLNQVLAPFKVLLDFLLNILQKVVGFLIDGAAATMKFLGSILSFIPGIDKLNKKSQESIQLEKEKQQLAKDERKMIVENSKVALEVSDLRAKANNKEKYSAEERYKFMEEALFLEEQQMLINKELAKEKLRIAQIEAARAENTAETERMLAELEADVFRRETEFNDKTRRMLEKKHSFKKELDTEAKEASKKALDAQKKDIEDLTNTIQQEHTIRLNQIKINNTKILVSDAEKNVRILEEEKLFSIKLISELKSRLKKIKDETLRKEISDKIVAEEMALFEKQRNIDSQMIAGAKEKYDNYVQIVEASYNSQKHKLLMQLNEMRISQEEYNVALLYLDERLTNDRLNLAGSYHDDLYNLNLHNNDLKKAALEASSENVVQLERDTSEKRAAIMKSALAQELQFRADMGLITEAQLQEMQLKALEQTYIARKELLEKEGLSTLGLDEAYEQAKTNMILDFENQRFSLRQQLGVATWNEEFQVRMANLKNLLDAEAITQDEYDKAMFNEKMNKAKAYYDQFAGMASNAVQALQQAEIDSVDAKYDAMIQAAGDNAEEVERLEHEKAQKKLDIEKKYADVNFAIKVSEIVANTAVAIMQGFAQMGPIAGAVAAAMLTATGAAQIVSANAERKKIKNMTLGGASSSSSNQTRVVTGKEEGGYIDVQRQQDGRMFKAKDRGSDRGYIQNPSLLVSENGEEFIASAQSVKNPTIRPILDIIDNAQKSGTAGQLNMQALMATGFATGGYPINSNSGNNMSTGLSNYEDRGMLNQILTILKKLDKDGVNAYILYSDLQKKMELYKESEEFANK